MTTTHETPPNFKPSTITITISREKAEQIQPGLEHLTCWVRGFNAAYDGDSGPPGYEQVRRMSLLLKEALL